MGLLLMCVAGPPYFIKAYPCISQPFIPFTFVLYVPWLFKQVYHGNGSDRAGYSMLASTSRQGLNLMTDLCSGP